MTKLIIKVIALLKCKKGESLMESLMAFFIFTMVMLTITTIIITSFKITGSYTTSANEQQVSNNLGILEKSPAVGRIITITGNGIDDVDVNVKLLDNDNLKSFFPED